MCPASKLRQAAFVFLLTCVGGKAVLVQSEAGQQALNHTLTSLYVWSQCQAHHAKIPVSVPPESLVLLTVAGWLFIQRGRSKSCCT